MFRFARGFLVFVPAVLWAGCGGEVSGGDAGFSTGLPPNQILGQASPAEQRQFCERFFGYFVSTGTLRNVCKIIGLSVSASPSECERSVAACVAGIEPAATADAIDRCAAAFETQPCDVAVGEIERCSVLDVQNIQVLATRISCTSTPEEVDAATQPVDEACRESANACPALGSSSSSSTDCCASNDPCIWANDGVCDCPAATWDQADCAIGAPPSNACYAPNDPCSFAKDGYCDCPGEAWDQSDCPTPPPSP
jgi:hypothetical protein